MMDIEPDIAGQVSADLATIMEAKLAKEDTDEPPTIGDVLAEFDEGLFDELEAWGRIEPSQREAVLHELQTLVNDYGEDALAYRFFKTRASEDLATVIQHELDNQPGDTPPTLGSVAEAVQHGLVAHLVGTGDINIDDDDTIVDELRHLIEKHGADSPAEDFLP